MAKTKFPGGVVAPFTDASGDAVSSLTDNSGGTSSDTIAAIGATYNQAQVQNAVASLAAKINELIAAQADS